MNMYDYPHCTLGEDGWVQTMGRHCPGLPRVLLCMLMRLGYDGPNPIYRCRPFQAHDLTCCEVWVEIPIDPAATWTILSRRWHTWRSPPCASDASPTRLTLRSCCSRSKTRRSPSGIWTCMRSSPSGRL
jgi:hypothetical protein